MGLGGFSLGHLLVVLLVVVLVFGTRKLRNMGGDLGAALKSFRSALREDPEPARSSEPGSSTEQFPPTSTDSKQPPRA